MYYVYFIFAGYRVAIGRTGNFASRLPQYKRTHRDIEVLGIITCESKEASKVKEHEILRLFQSDNDFRDMFFLSKEMRDWIVNHTSPIPHNLWTNHKTQINSKRKKYYRDNPDKQNERYRTDRERYKDTPDSREYQRKYQREWRAKNPNYHRDRRAKKRKKRPSSPQTLNLF